MMDATRRFSPICVGANEVPDRPPVAGNASRFNHSHTLDCQQGRVALVPGGLSLCWTAVPPPSSGRVPRTITVDRTAADPKATAEMTKDGELWRRSRLRQVKYLNNIVEQDHRNLKRLTRPGLGFGSFWTARRTLAGQFPGPPQTALR
jgi:hypothetical protein